MWRTLALIGLILSAMAAAKARADDCPGNPNALGTSRVMAIDPRDFPRIGKVQYSHTLPLADKEVVLSFDDGPLPPYTNRILEVLAEHCVRADYFIIGRMARGYPDLLRKISAAGHVIGSHSQNHPLAFERMPMPAVQDEVEQGFASLYAVLGDRRAVAPFFRIPGLLRAPQVESYLQSRGLVTWSADVVADDWKHINASEVVRRAISRLDEKGKGILLLHDIQPATALALPELLRELKVRGYRIVQVVPGRGPTPMPMAMNTAPPSAEPAARAVAESPPPGPIAMPAPAAPPTPAASPPAAVTTPAPPSPAALPASAQVPTLTPIVPPRPRENVEPAAAAKPAIPDAAAQSMALAPAVPHRPAQPYTSTFKPARNMSAPGKFINTDPGGWPPVVSVPVPSAGGVGVSPMEHRSETADGRFLMR